MTSSEYYPAPGNESISAESLQIPKAQSLAMAIPRMPFVKCVEFRRCADDPSSETVVCEIEVELGQVRKNDILRIERLAIVFDHQDKKPPEVLALRYDFPHVPHLNLKEKEFPRSLCLFDEPYADLKLKWTPVWFVERIRYWLSQTAKGELHGADQPLEPLLLEFDGQVVLPFDLFQNTVVLELLTVEPVAVVNNSLSFIVRRAPKNSNETIYTHVATALNCEPQTHGVISRKPSNLHQLHEFTASAGLDLLAELRRRLAKWQTEKPFPNILGAKLILIFKLPKRRHENGDAEVNEIRVFLSQDTIERIGLEIGVWEKRSGSVGLILPPDSSKLGSGIAVYLLNPTFSFNRDLAAGLNGLTTREARRITLIGGGALGSQLFTNLVRQGVGEWTLIDKDILLPHNLARNSLDGFALGRSKTECLAHIANATIDGEPIAKPIVADVLNPRPFAAEVHSALAQSDIIVDCSASVAVSRHLANDVESQARRLAIFLNPSGTDLVVLAEDEKRDFPLDYLEMQYYRYVFAQPELKNHLQHASRRARYANSCRNITSQVSQEHVSLNAAIASRAFRSAIAQPGPLIKVWQTDPLDLTVRSFECSLEKPIILVAGDWKILTDQTLLDSVRSARKKKLPNETGGVLVGSVDSGRRLMYVVEMIPSPRDSGEWPTVYVRGCEGLKQRVEEIERSTLGQLHYVGEWHSHPAGHDCRSSVDDRKAFSLLSDALSIDGSPALMLIVGDTDENWYLGAMG